MHALVIQTEYMRTCFFIDPGVSSKLAFKFTARPAGPPVALNTMF
jgi:hypothetical protein